MPWDFSDTELRSDNPLTLNVPTDLGRELGAELARLATVERLHSKNLPEPCHDCAFRIGTTPNGCERTLMDAVKCIVEGKPFNCHINKGKPCAGWLALKLPPAPGAQEAT